MRDQGLLMPYDLQAWLPEDHLARFVVDIVDQLDLRDVYVQYQGRGVSAYDPRLLLSLLFYGYATGVFSSRKLEAATYDSVAFRFIAGNLHPDHDTIAAFRKRFLLLRQSDPDKGLVQSHPAHWQGDGVGQVGQHFHRWHKSASFRLAPQSDEL